MTYFLNCQQHLSRGPPERPMTLDPCHESTKCSICKCVPDWLSNFDCCLPKRHWIRGEVAPGLGEFSPPRDRQNPIFFLSFVRHRQLMVSLMSLFSIKLPSTTGCLEDGVNAHKKKHVNVNCVLYLILGHYYYLLMFCGTTRSHFETM